MGGSAGKSESDSSNDFQSEVWGPQGNALQGLYGQMSNLWNQSNQQAQSQIPGATQGMQDIFNQSQPAWQNQLQGGAYSGMDLQGQYNQAFNQGGGNEQFIDQSIMGGQGNDYVDAMKAQMGQDSQDILNQNLNTNDLRASSTGLPGSSRHGITEGQIYDDSSKNLMNAQTNLGYQTFDKDLDRKLGIAQRADTYDAQRLNQAGQMLGNQNQAMQGGLNFGQGMQGLNMGQFAPGQVPWQQAGQYGNILGGPTILGSGSGDSSSKGMALGGGAKGG